MYLFICYIVYGVKVVDDQISLDLNGVRDSPYIEAGMTKTLVCKGSKRHQQVITKFFIISI